MNVGQQTRPGVTAYSRIDSHSHLNSSADISLSSRSSLLCKSMSNFHLYLTSQIVSISFAINVSEVYAPESISIESATAVEQVKGILDLDDDSFANIFRFLSPVDVLNAECVNKR